MVLTRQACSANCDDLGIRECGVLTRASGAAIASASSSAFSSSALVAPRRNLLELPPEIIMKILGYLPMKKVAETRFVSNAGLFFPSRIVELSGYSVLKTFFGEFRRSFCIQKVLATKSLVL